LWGCLCQAARLGTKTGQSDAELLGAFVDQRDEVAFEVLLRRHGPMVLAVCRRVLACESDVEDSFQATFLVLPRKAPSIWPRGQVGNFLYGVAQKTALKMRQSATRRSRFEREAGMKSRVEVDSDVSPEMLAALDRELLLLPPSYRAPI